MLVRDVFGTEPDESFCAACLEATGGNPLYLRALLITLEAEGAEPTAANAARVQEVGPEPVARAVSLRLSRLPAEAGALAQAIAVLGQTAELGLAAALAGLERPSPLAAADDLVRGELLRLEPLDSRTPSCAPRSTRASAATSAAEAHRRAAGLLVEGGAEPERAASHLLLVPPARDAFVVSILRTAAARARRTRSGERGRRLPAPRAGRAAGAAERGEVLGELGTIERSTDLTAAIEHLREAVQLIEEPQRYGDVALQYARALAYAGFDSAEAVEMYRAAIHSAVGANRPTLVEVATAELINACWAEAQFLGIAKTLLVDVRDDRLAGGFASDFLLALLAHWELRRGADRERTAALARRALDRRHARARVDAGHLLRARRAARRRRGRGRARGLRQRAGRGPRRAATCSTSAGCSASARWLLLDRGDLRAAEPDVRESIEFSSRARHRRARHVQRRLPLRLPARAGRARRGRARARARRAARAAAGELPLRRSSSARAAGCGSRSASRRPRSPTSRRSGGSPGRSS